MTVRPYDRARFEAATGLFDWSTQPMLAAIPKLGYVADLASHTAISQAQPFRGAPVSVFGQEVHPSGWLMCSPISINPPVNEPFDKLVIYRAADSLLMFLFEFPAITATTSSPMVVTYGIANLGLGRL